MAKKAIVAEQAPLGETTADYIHAIAVPDTIVEYVQTGQELVTRVGAGGYSLVLVGCCVDGTRDGPDIVRQIRKLDPEVPVYMLSLEGGNENTQTQARAMAAGATGYLRHLINRAEIAALPEKYLQ